MLREVAAELAPPSVRRGLHGKVADALTHGAVGDPDWRLVAAHYEQAERYADAASAYREASGDARRRGALEEARSYLTHALTQLEKCPPSSERDRLEIGPRLERGFLASAAEGYHSRAVAGDVERCLQLLGTDLRDDQLFATLIAVNIHYFSKADLQRADQLAAALQRGQQEGRQWWKPTVDCVLGLNAFLRGEYPSARSFFEQASAGFTEDDEHRMDDVWLVPHDAVAVAYEHLAMYHVLHGDVAAADSNIAKAMQRADELGFPMGPYNHVFAMDLEIKMCSEAHQFERAAALVTDMIEKAEQYGFDFWRILALSERSMINSRILLNTDDPDIDALLAESATLTQIIDSGRYLGMYAYLTLYDCVIGQLLIAAGRCDEAQARINAALQIADDTEMHYYDAELLRVRARTHTDPDSRAADLAAAIELARRQDAPLFELRAALDDFELRGPAARAVLCEAADRLPVDSALPELVRAHAVLR